MVKLYSKPLIMKCTKDDIGFIRDDGVSRFHQRVSIGRQIEQALRTQSLLDTAPRLFVEAWKSQLKNLVMESVGQEVSLVAVITRLKYMSLVVEAGAESYTYVLHPSHFGIPYWRECLVGHIKRDINDEPPF